MLNVLFSKNFDATSLFIQNTPYMKDILWAFGHFLAQLRKAQLMSTRFFIFHPLTTPSSKKLSAGNYFRTPPTRVNVRGHSIFDNLRPAPRDTVSAGNMSGTQLYTTGHISAEKMSGTQLMHVHFRWGERVKMSADINSDCLQSCFSNHCARWALLKVLFMLVQAHWHWCSRTFSLNTTTLWSVYW